MGLDDTCPEWNRHLRSRGAYRLIRTDRSIW